MSQSTPEQDPDPRRPKMGREKLMEEIREAVNSPDFLGKSAEFQEKVAEFGFRAQQALQRMDPLVRAAYRRRVIDLADDLIHLLDVKYADLGNLDDMRRSTVLTTFLMLDDDDDDPEPDPTPPKTPSDMVPA
jgi:hypothetical protein